MWEAPSRYSCWLIRKLSDLWWLAQGRDRGTKGEGGEHHVIIYYRDGTSRVWVTLGFTQTQWSAGLILAALQGLFADGEFGFSVDSGRSVELWRGGAFALGETTEADR